MESNVRVQELILTDLVLHCHRKIKLIGRLFVKECFSLIWQPLCLWYTMEEHMIAVIGIVIWYSDITAKDCLIHVDITLLNCCFITGKTTVDRYAVFQLK